MRKLVKHPNSFWWDNKKTRVVESLNQIFRQAFTEAVDELERVADKNPNRWRWGSLHTVTFRNLTLGESGIAPIEKIFNRGPFPAAGGSAILNATEWDATSSFAVTWLPSMRMIVDMANLVNGLLILLEDQYDIGDVIAVDGAAGFVENLNLRTTQLRNAEGRLIVLPNSTISRVENLTRTWSRVDHTIEVAASTNANQAITVIQKVAQCLYDDPQFRPLIIEPPEVLGIDQVSHAGILIRTLIKTQPLQQWKVGREFRLRLKKLWMNTISS